MTMWMLSISHYQPVALTSRVMKCLEKLEVSIIRPMVKPHSPRPLGTQLPQRQTTESKNLHCNILHYQHQHGSPTRLYPEPLPVYPHTNES